MALLVLLLTCLPPAAQALAPIVLGPDQPPVSLDGRSLYWIDTAAPGQQRDVQVLEAGAAMFHWAPHAPGQQYLIDEEALWIQFDAVQPAADNDGHWYLEIGQSGLDRAQLLYRDAHGHWVVQEAGDSRRVADWPVPGRFPTFELAPHTREPVRYWLRIEQSRLQFSAPLLLYRQPDLMASHEQEQFLIGAFAGLSLLMVIVATASALVYRDPLFGTFALYVLLMSLGQLAYLGFGAQYLWPEAVHWRRLAPFVLPSLSTAMALWFVRRVTEPQRFSLGLDSVVLAVIATLVVIVAADALFNTPQTFAAVLSLRMLAMVVVTLLIVRVWLRGDDPHIALIALGFLPVVLLTLFPVARGLHLLPAGTLTRYGSVFGSVLEMPLIYYALHRRSAFRRDAEARTRALSETDPLTGLTHQRILMLRLDNALARARRQRTQCALLGIDLANHAQMVEAHGQEGADRALVVAGARLRQVISDIDVVSRTGDHQFTLLLDGPTTAARARACATRIVAQGLRERQEVPGGGTLQFNVVVAMLPQGVLDAADTVTWVSEALTIQPALARKAIVMLNA